MNIIIQIILAILIVIVVAGLIGFAIAKIKFNRMVKKLDVKVNSPQEQSRINNLIIDNKLNDYEREVRHNGRRERFYKPIGRPGFEGIGKPFEDFTRERSENTRTSNTNQFNGSERSNEGQYRVQDSTSFKDRSLEPKDDRNERKPEEDWPDFS